jgi:hypothetical protein
LTADEEKNKESTMVRAVMLESDIGEEDWPFGMDL